MDQIFHQDSKIPINKAISMACRKERKRDLVPKTDATAGRKNMDEVQGESH